MSTVTLPVRRCLWSAAQEQGPASHAQPGADASMQARGLERMSGMETQESFRLRGWADSDPWGSLDAGGGLLKQWPRLRLRLASQWQHRAFWKGQEGTLLSGFGDWGRAGLWVHACSSLRVFSTCNIFPHLQTAPSSMRWPPAQMLPSEHIVYLYFKHGGLSLVFAVFFPASVGSG